MEMTNTVRTSLLASLLITFLSSSVVVAEQTTRNSTAMDVALSRLMECSSTDMEMRKIYDWFRSHMQRNTVDAPQAICEEKWLTCLLPTSLVHTKSEREIVRSVLEHLRLCSDPQEEIDYSLFYKLMLIFLVIINVAGVSGGFLLYRSDCKFRLRNEQ